MWESPFILTIVGNSIVAVGIILAVLLVRTFIHKVLGHLIYVTACTVGLLLGIIFLGFFPELTTTGFVGIELGISVLMGILLFYLFELFLHWHHCRDMEHDDTCKHYHNEDKHHNGMLMFGSTLLHNMFHGIILFSSFSVDVSFGVATTIAILLHSIPQNIVNYIMNKNNIHYTYFAAMGTVIGALIMFPLADIVVSYKLYILAVISGGLLYTALADMLPEFKAEGTISHKFIYLFFIIIGIFMFIGFEWIGSVV